ncbi:hypothetical protein J7E22_16685 [Curtobacterium sp. ISL-83]|nr:hypothetical protein [Curtobacterium sp. ISL-83]
MIRYIEQHKDRFGAEVIRRVLRPAVSGFLTSSGYRRGLTAGIGTAAP